MQQWMNEWAIVMSVYGSHCGLSNQSSPVTVVIKISVPLHTNIVSASLQYFMIQLCETDTQYFSGLILGLCPANERRFYKVTSSLIGWAQT